MIEVELKPEYYSYTKILIRMLQGLSQVLLFVIVLGFLIKLGLQGRYFSELPRNVLDDVSEKAQLKEMLANKDQTMSETFFCYIRDLNGFKFIVAFIINHILIL